MKKWLQEPANRDRLYGVLRALGPALIAAGLLTPNQVQVWLNIAAAMLFSGFSVAKKNVPKE